MEGEIPFVPRNPRYINCVGTVDGNFWELKHVASTVASLVANGSDGKFSSPMRYREGPLDYESTVYCNCAQKAARWVSWSDVNPRRRYLTCAKARMSGNYPVLWSAKCVLVQAVCFLLNLGHVLVFV